MQAEGVAGRVGQTQLLDRTIKGLLLALLAASIGFTLYYYADRRSTPGPTPLDQAISRAEQAVRASPGDSGARVAIGDLYLARGRYAEAIEQHSEALHIEPDLQAAHRGLAVAYTEQGRYADAEPEWQKIVQARKDGEFASVDKALQEAYYYLGRVHSGLQRPDEAIESLERALQINRTDADAWLLLGSTYLATGRSADATTALARAVALVPKFAEAYQLLAQAYRAQGDETGARYAQAMARYSQGATDEAIHELRAVTTARPDFAAAWTGLGLANETKSLKVDAAQAYHRALALNPDDFGASAGLMRLGASSAGPSEGLPARPTAPASGQAGSQP